MLAGKECILSRWISSDMWTRPGSDTHSFVPSMDHPDLSYSSYVWWESVAILSSLALHLCLLVQLKTYWYVLLLLSTLSSIWPKRGEHTDCNTLFLSRLTLLEITFLFFKNITLLGITFFFGLQTFINHGVVWWVPVSSLKLSRNGLR